MLDDVDFSSALVYAIPMTTRFRGITVREGILLRGPAGWAEFCPFDDYDDQVSASWLATAVEQCTIGWPTPVRDHIPINCTVPAVGPDRAHEIASISGCSTAKIKVADHPDSLAEDIARVEAVRDAFGPNGKLRVDANGVWDVDTAIKHITLLDKAASGLEYVEQPCRTIEELAAVRRQVNAPIAADESIRRAEDPMRVAVAGAADVAVIKCTPSAECAEHCASPKRLVFRALFRQRLKRASGSARNWRLQARCRTSTTRAVSARSRCSAPIRLTATTHCVRLTVSCQCQPRRQSLISRRSKPCVTATQTAQAGGWRGSIEFDLRWPTRLISYRASGREATKHGLGLGSRRPRPLLRATGCGWRRNEGGSGARLRGRDIRR